DPVPSLPANLASTCCVFVNLFGCLLLFTVLTCLLKSCLNVGQFWLHTWLVVYVVYIKPASDIWGVLHCLLCL
ncbi:hypothetical protein B0H10DRAFT_2203747, partial [Mycena sp. CBHHK59/15]